MVSLLRKTFIAAKTQPITTGTLTKNFSFSSSGYAIAKTWIVSLEAAFTFGSMRRKLTLR
jgi:hypothetical protein